MTPIFQTERRYIDGEWVRILALPDPMPPFEPDAFNRRAPRVGDIARVVDVRDDAPEYELECREGDRINWLRPVAAGEFDLEPCAPFDDAPTPATLTGGVAAALAVAAVLSWLLTPWVWSVLPSSRSGDATMGLHRLVMSLNSTPAMMILGLAFLIVFLAILAVLLYATEAARAARSERRNRR
jgi:hypothetical protein